ncbi:MAG: DUF4142 domain-containing protein [Gemmatimonadota bacterium]
MKTHQYLPATTLAVLAALMSGVASAQVKDTMTSVTTSTTVVQQVTTKPVSSSDSAIVATLIAANQREVAEADVAINHAQSEHVREFARRIQRDHAKAVEGLENFLPGKSGGMSSGIVHDTMKMDGDKMTPPADSTYAVQHPKNDSMTVGQQGDASYQGKTGRDFDKAWIDAIEDHHKEAIENLRNSVIPKIQDASLKTLVAELLPVMDNHLREAEAIEAELK